MNGTDAERAERPPAVSACLEVMKTRADFLACARARKQVAPGFILQGRERDASGTIRIGFTASKKVGNAVARNRAKRRLRAIARALLPSLGQSGWDYVLVARKSATADLPFAQLEDDLARALIRLHAPRNRTAP